MKRVDFLIIIFFIIISIFALRDLWGEGFYTSHDGSHQVARLYYFDKLLRDGQVPPRWVSELQNGYGYPLFIFSYQLPWFIAEPFYVAGFSIFDSIKLTFLIGFILSGLSMYVFLKKTTGRMPAFAGAMLYLFAPYRFSNIFVRGAIGDATAFIFPPLIFLSLHQLSQNGRFKLGWIAVGALAVAALLLSHAMVFTIFMMATVLYGIVLFIQSRTKRRYILRVLIMFILGLGICAYYLIPSIAERGQTKFLDTVGPELVGSTFLRLKDLIYTPWGYGVFHSEAGAMSLQLGITLWLVIFAISFLLLLSAFKSFRIQPSSITVSFWLIMFILTILAMFPPSLVFWKFTSKYFIIDYMFRILALSVFICAVLAAYVVKNMRWQKITVLLLIILTFYANRNHLRVNQRLMWPLSLYLDVETTTNTYEEYTPKWVNTNYVKKKRPKVEFTGRNAEIAISTDKSNQLDFDIFVKEAGDVIINSVYYPGWKYYVDGSEKKLTVSDNGMIKFWLEEGQYLIQAKWTETPLRQLSNILSIFSVGLIGLLIITSKKISL